MKYKIIYGIILVLFFNPNNSFAQKNFILNGEYKDSAVTIILIHPSLTIKFYQLNNQQLFWFTTGVQSQALKLTLKDCIDSAVNTGLNVNKYHYNEIIAATEKTNTTDRLKSFKDVYGLLK